MKRMPKSFFIFSKTPAACTACPHFENGSFLSSRYLRLFFSLGLFLLSGINNVNAQSNGYEYTDSSILSNNEVVQADPGNETPETDTILYKRIITIPKDSIDSWKNEKKFAYIKDLDSLLKDRMKEERNVSQSSPSFLQMILSSGFIQVIFWLIAIGVVVFVLYKLFLSKGNFIFKRNTSSDVV